MSRRNAIARRRNPLDSTSALAIGTIAAAGAGAGFIIGHIATKRKLLAKPDWLAHPGSGRFIGYSYTLEDSGREGDYPAFAWSVVAPDGTSIAGGRAVGITNAFSQIGAALETVVNVNT